MALVVKDRVQETTTTVGTGTYTLAGAQLGYQSFATIGNGNTTYYAVTNGTDWEVGIGTYTSSGTTLSRDTILASSNSNNAVSWAAGTKSVFVTYPAGKSIYQDASGNTFVPNLGASTASSGSFTSLTDSGNLTFTGTGNRITGDFSSVPVANRVLFQNSTTNALTVVGAIPNGTATGAYFQLSNNSDPDNAGYAYMGLTGAELTLTATKLGTGSYVPITFGTGGSERMRLDTSGNVGIGTTPATKLHVKAATNVNIKTTDNSGAALIIATNDAGSASVPLELYGSTVKLISSGTTALTADSSGNVGIGTPAPSTKLSVVNSGGSGSIVTAIRTVNQAGGTSGSGIEFAGTYSDTAPNNAFTAGAIYGQTVSGASNGSGVLLFYTQSGGTNAERMRIDSSGNVGIGVLPNFRLESYTGTTNGTTINSRGYLANAAVDTRCGTIRNSFDSNTAYSTFWTAFRGGGGASYKAIFGVAAGSGDVDVLTFDSSGNVGIGTSSPAPEASGNIVLQIKGAGTYERAQVHLTNATSGEAATDGFIMSFDSSVNAYLFNREAGALICGTNNTERMRIDSSGNVGIGTSSPGYKLEVSGGAYVTGNSGIGTTPFSSNTPVLTLGSIAYALGFYDTDGTANQRKYVFGYSGSTLSLQALDDSNGFLREIASFAHGGNLTCAGVYSATVGATNRDVYVDSTGLIGYVSSLRASKTNIAPLSDTAWLYNLDPVRFNYRKKDEDGNYTDEVDGDIQYGMIAEDVEQVRPDLCFYDEVDGNQELRGIQYSKLIPVLVKAIQELKAEIEVLKGN